MIDLKEKLHRSSTIPPMRITKKPRKGFERTLNPLLHRVTPRVEEPTTPGNKRHMTPGAVERIVTPVKPTPQRVLFATRSSAESGWDESEIRNPMDFFSSFLDLLEYFRADPINIKEANKAIKKMARVTSIPGCKEFRKIEDESACYSPSFNLTLRLT
jgi:hypothetical protein